MSIELFERGDKSTTRQIEDAKRLTNIQKEIDKIWRVVQREDSLTAIPVTLVVDEEAVSPTQHSVLAGLAIDDHVQYILHDGSRAMTGDFDMNDLDIKNINVAKFNITPTNATPSEGDFWYNSLEGTMNLKTDKDVTLQMNQETVLRIYNNTGVQLNNGEVVYINGATSDRPTVALGNNGVITTAETVIAIATHNIPNAEEGFVTIFGTIRDLDTSAWSAGDKLYLDSTDGQLTNVKPTFPAWIVEMAHVNTVHATEGEITFHAPNLKDNDQFFNGSIAENFDALVTSNGTVITYSLQRSGGGNLTMRFSDGYSILVCAPLTVALTVGTDTIPQVNWIYVLKSAPTVMTVSTTQLPTAEHIPIGYVYVQSATKVQADGALINQNINNYMASVSSQIGRLQIMSKKIRKLGINYDSGIDANGDTSTYFVHGVSSVLWKSTAGVIYQMHEQAIPAYDMLTQDAHVVNHATVPFNEVTDLFQIVDDAGGNTIGNAKYFNLVFWMVGNKGGEYSPLMVNVPNDVYSNSSLAQIDADQTNVYDIPREFNIESSTGFLVGWATFQKGATSWTLVKWNDLRGKPVGSVGGGSTGFQTEFPDNTFAIFDNLDNTKIINFDASSITTGNTRTITMPDTDLTLAGIDVVNVFSTNNTFSTQIGIGTTDFEALHSNYNTGVMQWDFATWQMHETLPISIFQNNGYYNSVGNYAQRSADYGSWRIIMDRNVKYEIAYAPDANLDGTLSYTALLAIDTSGKVDITGQVVVTSSITLGGRIVGQSAGTQWRTSLATYSATSKFINNDVRSETDGSYTKDVIYKYARNTNNAYTPYKEMWYDGNSYVYLEAISDGIAINGNVDIVGTETPIFKGTDLSSSNEVWMGAQNSTTFTGNNSNVDHQFLRNNSEKLRLTSTGISITGDQSITGQISLTGAPNTAVIRTVDATTDYLHCYTNQSGFGVKLTVDAVAWASASDIRYKNNIRSVSTLDKIMMLDTIEYDLYTNMELTGVNIPQIGVSAQSLREQFPMLVVGDEATEQLSVNYTQLSAIFINAIKELKVEGDAKDERITLLETELTNTNTRINSLEERIMSLETP